MIFDIDKLNIEDYLTFFDTLQILFLIGKINKIISENRNN